ncbi:uncharacterized protein I303_104842 [Kwoniella dejecticola CBS 10117]|uniref:Uncharacterized protein n=1 Tax=Kwoniella dejecticola CBS 10117 TaxID=1296121 RepID=A0A1A6A472_9TREE|nr:uncharacterized protein I303_04176 [Kwoniella dejecticola CBS 10117]OBR84855.1 hypothetical protein I303_04176 [Kwoniella dejecticola CBS 10117]
MPKYTLYQLVGDASNPDGRVISPHVWKTKLDLAFFKQEVNNSSKTFPQIRGELSELTKNPAVTVPTIEVDGEFTTDSWKIAEYLEAEHGTPDRSLFGGTTAGKEFAKFIEIWSNTTFANELRPLVGVAITSHFDSPSKAYFIKSKFGGDILKHSNLVDKFQDPEELERQLSAARNRLAVINDLLKYKKAKNESLYLLGGTEPSHADFALFGWFTSSTLHPAVEKGVWRHADNELVGEWLDLILDSGLVDKAHLQ